MKLTLQQLKDLGYVESSPGLWVRPTGTLDYSPTVKSIPYVVRVPPKPPKRIRQSTKPLMNKLEQEWLEFYGKWFDAVHAQGIRFKLANGIWYKPDFVAFKVMTCWEIKGPHAFRGGFENLKVAASKYPEFKWILCWKKDGGWQEQRVLP